MRHCFHALATLVAFTCGPVLAQDGPGAADVVPEDVRRDIADCISVASTTADGLACLSGDAVSEAARRFATETEEGSALDVVAILTGVDALERITIATAHFPALSGEEPQTVLMMRAPRAVPLVELVFAPDPPGDGETRAILARHPSATEASQPSITGYRILPDGTQRLIVTDTVRDGCATCDAVATSVVYVDVLSGVLASTRRVGWFDVESNPAVVADRLEAVDLRVLQRRLILSGYDAGPVDGQVGPRTRAAFYALKADHCLPEDPRIRPVIPMLSATTGALAPAPCAPDPGFGGDS